MRVLQIGTGSGYLAALIAEVVGTSGHVVTIEIDPEVSDRARSNLDRCGYEHVESVVGDGYCGHGSGGPYDRIVATASCFDVPSAWVGQLAPDGCIILPLALTQRASCYPMVWLRRQPGGLRGGVVAGLPRVGFIPLYGPCVPHPVLYEPTVSQIEAAVELQLRKVTQDRTHMAGLWLTALLQIATAVLSDWENHLRWDRESLGSRAAELWREAGEPQVPSFVLEVNGGSPRPADYRWDYHEHGRTLAVWIQRPE